VRVVKSELSLGVDGSTPVMFVHLTDLELFEMVPVLAHDAR
jgi:hypothetical protein